MSYVRFSSDNFKSDVYVYADVSGGYTIHVAGVRAVSDTPIPEIPEGWWKIEPDSLIAAVKAQHEWMKSARRVPIGGEWDGATLNEPDIPRCIERLLKIRAAGYNVPQFAIDDLRAELDDDAED